MRIVFDTNVLIAAFIAQGVCHKLFEHCILHHTVVISQFILDEIKAKFTKKFKLSAERVREVEILLYSRLEIVDPGKLELAVCRDPDDDNILAAAVAGNCDCIVTGDKDLLVLENFEGVKILKPSDFAEYESNFG